MYDRLLPIIVISVCYTQLYMKKGPLFLLISLLLICIFILGIQYGKRIEIANKAFTFTPTISPSPKATKESSFTFSPYTHTGCGLSFTRPTSFKATKESSLSATLEYNKQIISFECPQKQVNQLAKTDKTTATSSVILNDKKIKAVQEGENIRFIEDHPYRKTPVIFSIDHNLLPLIESSLKFTK